MGPFNGMVDGYRYDLGLSQEFSGLAQFFHFALERK